MIVTYIIDAMALFIAGIFSQSVARRVARNVAPERSDRLAKMLIAAAFRQGDFVNGHYITRYCSHLHLLNIHTII